MDFFIKPNKCLFSHDALCVAVLPRRAHQRQRSRHQQLHQDRQESEDLRYVPLPASSSSSSSSKSDAFMCLLSNQQSETNSRHSPSERKKKSSKSSHLRPCDQMIDSFALQK